MAEQSIIRSCAAAQPKTIITPQARITTASVFTPRGKEYFIELLFPKDADLSELRALLHTAVVEKWGNDRQHWPASLKDLDFQTHVTDNRSDGWPIVETDDGFTIRAKSNADFKPTVVDARLQRLFPDNLVGRTGRAELGAWAFIREDGSCGVAFNLFKLQVLDEEQEEALDEGARHQEDVGGDARTDGPRCFTPYQAAALLRLYDEVADPMRTLFDLYEASHRELAELGVAVLDAQRANFRACVEVAQNLPLG